MKKVTLLSLLLWGCWDFESLTGTQVPNDANPPADLLCNKVPNNLKEDCSDPTADKNNDCRPGCEDTGCATTSTYCMANRDKFLGVGNLSDTTPNCAGGTVVAVHHTVATPPACATACSCTTARCEGTVSLYDTTDCTGPAAPTVTLPPATTCSQITSTATKSTKLDSLSTKNCSPTQATATVNVGFAVNKYLCHRVQEGFFSELSGSYQCLVFTGDVSCPATYTKKTTYYTDANVEATCTCACSVGAQSCAIGGNQLTLADTTDCKTAGGAKSMTINAINSCLEIKDNGTSFLPKSLRDTAAPVCQAGGTVTNVGTPKNARTLCCV